MKLHILAVTAICLMAFSCPVVVPAREYQFASIATNVGYIYSSFVAPLIDASGQVTYYRRSPDGDLYNAIARGTGAMGSNVDVVSWPDLAEPDFGPELYSFDINEAGDVALTTRGQSWWLADVYRSHAGVLDKITTIDSNAPTVAIGENGLLVFGDDMGRIYTSDDPNQPIAEMSPYSTYTVRVNSSGQIGFGGQQLGVVQPSGTIDYATTPPADLGTTVGIFDFNNAGDMVFITYVQDDGGYYGAYVLHGDTTTLIADSRTNFVPDYNTSMGINNLGEIAMRGTIDTGHLGIFTGGDPVADKVIQTGDPLAGSIVQDIFYGHGINDAGQIAFWASLEDGRTGVFRADPVDVSLPGDANLDGVVDGVDYTIWADHFLATGQTWEAGDFSGDGIVDGADYTIWADHFAPALSLSAVPEPSTLALAGIGTVGILAFARRRIAG